MKSRFLFVALLVALVACLSVGSAFAADLEQSDVSDVIVDDVSVSIDADVSSVSANSGSWNDLQKKIDSTSAGGTLDLDTDYSFNAGTDDDEGVSITKDITINGNGFTLDGKNLARILNISGSTVTINNLNFINANVKADYYHGSGGAILANYSDLTLNGCTFENNNGTYGGAIDCEDGDLYISNCSFVNNKASGETDGEGGAIYFDEGNVIINNCDFTNNLAKEDGGAINLDGNGTIINSTFKDNSAPFGDGGAIYSEYGNCTIENSIFNHNFAGDNKGGAIYSEYSNLTLKNTNFTDNYVANDNNNSCYGGAVYFYPSCYNGNLLVSACNFEDNYIISDNYAEGGALYTDDGNVTITDSNFTGNYIDTEYYAYGAAIEFSYGSLDIDNCNFVNNYIYSTGDSSCYGAVIDANTCNLTISDSNFTGNYIDTVNYAYGGAIYNYGNLSIDNSNFDSNYISSSDDDGSSYGGCIYASPSSENDYVIITDSKFLGNYINSSYCGYGGAIYYDSSYDITVDHCIFDGNAADKGNAIATYYDNCSYDFDKNYWAMNFTSEDEFIKAKLIYLEHWENETDYGDYIAPDNWVLMSISGPSDVKAGYNESYTVKFDKLTNGRSVSDFADSMPDYVTKVYAFDTSAEPNYNHAWDNENPTVGEFVADVEMTGGEGTFNYIASGEDTYYFRTFSPITNWEESVMGPVESTMPVADLDIKVVADKSKYYIGDKIVYTITVTNNGPDKAVDTIVNDILPNSLKFVSAKASKGAYVYDDGVWTIGTLEDGETVTLTITVIAKEKGTIVNEVGVSSFSIDPKPESDIDSVSVKVVKKQEKPDPKPDPTPNPTPSKGATLPAAGNPLALVVLSLLTLCAGGLKRKL